MPSLRGGHVLVIGSENPWIEACILHAGARHVTTLEYGHIISEHKKVSTLTPAGARQAFANGTLPLFDSIVTYSSVEHSGLGRYGDQLNPWGDLQAVARAWCVCKPGGHLLLGVMEAPRDSNFFFPAISHTCVSHRLDTNSFAIVCFPGNWTFDQSKPVRVLVTH